MTTEVIEAEVVSREIVPAAPPAPPAALFGTTDPAEVIAKAQAMSAALAGVIRQQHLASNIQGKEYVRCEGWTLLGSMVGVFPVLEWCRPLADGAGWEARVEAKTLGGAVVGAAEAECLRSERSWSNRDDYALRSMAQTRATSKALRMPLGFIMALANYEVTPAEEMTFAQESDARAERIQNVNAGHQERVAARNAAKTPKASPAAKPDIQTPLCPGHKIDCEYVPAGVSAKTGKKYGAFYSCPKRDCTAGSEGQRFSIFLDAWQDILSQQANESAPREEYNPDDLPNE